MINVVSLFKSDKDLILWSLEGGEILIIVKGLKEGIENILGKKKIDIYIKIFYNQKKWYDLRPCIPLVNLSFCTIVNDNYFTGSTGSTHQVSVVALSAVIVKFLSYLLFWNTLIYTSLI